MNVRGAGGASPGLPGAPGSPRSLGPPGVPGSRGLLAGQVVLVPRSAGQGAALATLLAAHGAEPLSAPAIAILPAPDTDALDGALSALAGGRFSWVAFTSRNGVEAAAARWAALALPPARIGGARVAVVGKATAAAVRSMLGAEPDLLPQVATAAGLAAAFPTGAGEEVLLLRGDLAAGDLPAGLRTRGWRPVEVVAYRTEPLGELPEPVRSRLEAGAVDWIAFTSGSTVDGFRRSWPQALPARTRVAVIGPVTAAAARAAGLVVDAEAVEPTVEGLLHAMAACGTTSGAAVKVASQKE